jgi:hypothetical protein
MHTYIFDCEGVILGGLIVVVAKSAKHAKRIAKDRATKAGLDRSTVKYVASSELQKPGSIYFYNGDY